MLLAVVATIILACAVHFPLSIATPSKNVSQTAIDMLEQLRSNVESLPDVAFSRLALAGQYRNALSNKIGAVIHQVEAGAIKGAIEKLTNDLIDKIDKWTIDPSKTQLMEQVNDIIDLLGQYL
jgi:hypothetical protein